jgi:hypothetical protein
MLSCGLQKLHQWQHGGLKFHIVIFNNIKADKERKSTGMHSF